MRSGGTPKMKNGAPRDELKNGRGRGWAVPYLGSLEHKSISTVLWVAKSIRVAALTSRSVPVSFAGYLLAKLHWPHWCHLGPRHQS